MNTQPNPLHLELWFDFSCPYAYLASQRAHVLAPAAVIDWRPMLLGGIFRGIGAGDGPMATLSPQKAAHNLADMRRWAARFGVPFQMPAAHPMRTVRALRTLLGLPHPRWSVAIAAIYAAYWQRAEDITRDDVLEAALGGAGIPRAEIAAAVVAADTDAIKDELRRRTDEAIGLGIFGAPAWIVRDPAILVWGQDRFAWLAAIAEGWRPDEAAPPPGDSRALAPPPLRSDASFDVYFDVASPFAYLGLTQLPALVAAGARPRLRPILLGGLFREIGQADVPLFAMTPPKRAYVAREMVRWARWWGVPFDGPRKFPQRTVAAQRLALVATRAGDLDAALRLAIALGRAMWSEQADLEDLATLGRILAAEGLPAAWLDAIATDEIKAALVDSTAAARTANVFGVPTFVVDGELFWGQDRLELVVDALAAR